MSFKVAYATGSRADYGIVRRYLNYLNKDKNIILEILVTGSLLEEQYGSSYEIIEEDKFYIAVKIPIDLDSSLNSKVIRSMAIALEKFGNYFEINKYDLLIILGDRYEMLSVATAAAMNKIPILHIHGGEITLGNYDEFIRHSITKMSNYHFTSTEKYRKRVIQLGEHPNTVYNIGAMGSENCKTIDMNNVSKDIVSLLDKKYFVVLFHPETLSDKKPIEQISILLNSLKNFIDKYQFIFIGSNADTGSHEMRHSVNNFIKFNKNALYYENLHPDAYHYLVKHAVALIGNSSSGIIEAPTLGTYTINIGNRQKGRERGKSIIDINCTNRDITYAINKVVFLNLNSELDNPYFKENSSLIAYKKTMELLMKKREIREFYDLNDINV